MNNRQQILSKVKKLYTIFQEGKIPTLEIHVVHPTLPKGSRENYLYFTLAPSLNFQRSSPALWQSALKTYEDPQTQYLFFPEEVVNTTREKIQKRCNETQTGSPTKQAHRHLANPIKNTF